MDDELRGEINRLWTDLQATQLLLAHVAAATMDEERIVRWHEAGLAHVDGRADWSEGLRINMGRALDRLAVHLRDARRARDGNPPPG